MKCLPDAGAKHFVSHPSEQHFLLPVHSKSLTHSSFISNISGHIRPPLYAGHRPGLHFLFSCDVTAEK